MLVSDFLLYKTSFPGHSQLKVTWEQGQGVYICKSTTTREITIGYSMWNLTVNISIIPVQCYIYHQACNVYQFHWYQYNCDMKVCHFCTTRENAISPFTKKDTCSVVYCTFCTGLFRYKAKGILTVGAVSRLLLHNNGNYDNEHWVFDRRRVVLSSGKKCDTRNMSVDSFQTQLTYVQKHCQNHLQRRPETVTDCPSQALQ